MKLGIAVGTIGIGLMGIQAAVANQFGGVPGMSERDENRQILITMEGADYDPSSPTHVVTGPAHALSDVVVPASQAIELHLDQLQEYGISLVDLIAQPASETEPEWPLAGQVQFREKGWKQMGARCPVVEPQTPAEVEDLYDAVVPGDDNRLGRFTTTVSEFAVNEFNQVSPSFLHFWNANQDPATELPAQTWEYTGWTLEAAFLIDYFCREPLAARGQVVHDSFVIPYVDRVDDA